MALSAPPTWLLALLAGGLALALAVSRLRARRVWPASQVATPAFYPLVGSLPALRRGIDAMPDLLLDCARQFGWGRPFAFYLPGTSILLVTDGASVEYVMKTAAASFGRTDGDRELTLELLGRGIAVAEGQSWRMQRRIGSHLFTMRNVTQRMKRVFEARTEQLLRHSRRAEQNKSQLAMQDLFHRFTLQSFVEIAFQRKLDLLAPDLPHFAFGDAFDELQEHVSRRVADPLWAVKKRLNIGRERATAKCAKIVHAFIDEFIDECVKDMAQVAPAPATPTPAPASPKQALQSEHKQDETPSSPVAPTSPSSPTSKPVFSNLVAGFLSHAGSVDERALLHDFLLNFLAGSRDTTASLLGWALLEIIRRPLLQEQLAEECAAALVEPAPASPSDADGQDECANVTEVDPERLPLLSAVLHETLRLHPPAPLSARSAFVDATLPNGVHVPKGTLLMLSAYVAGRDESVWGGDAGEFRPERWMPGGSAHANPVDAFSWPVFSAGARSCIGRHVALLESKILLARLLAEHHFALAPGSRHASPLPPGQPDYVYGVVSRLRGELDVLVTPRSSHVPTEMAVAN